MEIERGNVFVTNASLDQNYAAANKYGSLVNMTGGYIDLKKLNKVQEVFRSYMNESNSETDYLLLSGSGLVYSIALKIWFEFNHKCNILYYNKTTNEYDLYIIYNKQ